MGWFDKLAQNAADMGAAIKETSANVAASARATAKQVATSVQSAFDKTRETAGNTYDSAKQSLAEGYDKAKAAGSAAAQKVGHAAASVKESFAQKPAAQPVLVCTVPPGTPPPRNDLPPCCVTGLTVRCSHGSRQYTVKAPGAKQRDNRYVLQVLGTAQEPDELTVSLDGGPCVQGKPGATGRGQLVPDISQEMLWPTVNATGEKVSVRAPAPFKVKAYGPDAHDFTSLALFIKAMMKPASVMQTTELSVISCSGGQDYDVRVEVFPPLKGKFSFNLGRQVTYGFDSSKDKVKIAAETWKLAFSPVELSCGSTRIKFLDLEAANKWDDSSNRHSLFTRVRGVLGGLLKFADYVGNGKVVYTPPSFQFDLEVAATEQPGDWRVQNTGTIKVGFNPLLAANITFDILEPLIRAIGAGSSAISGPAGPVLAEILIKARRVAGSDAPVEVRLDLIISGEIAGGVKWMMPTSGQGQVDGSVGVDLKGKAKAEVRTFLVSAGVTGTMGAKTKFGARVGAAIINETLGFNGRLFFDGLKIYYAVDVHLGYGAKDEPPTSRSSFDSDVKTKVGSSGTTWTLVDAAYWPERESFVDLSDDFF